MKSGTKPRATPQLVKKSKMSRPPSQTLSILAMFAIVLCTGYMAFGAKREAEVRSMNRTRISRAEEEKLNVVEDLGNEFINNRNRVGTFKNDEAEITGTESFRLAELHRSHQIRVQEELERAELAGAQDQAQVNAHEEDIYDKIDEEILTIDEKAAEALQKATTRNVNTVVGSAQHSFDVIDKMHQNHLEASKNLIKMAKTGKRKAINAVEIKRENVTRKSNPDGPDKKQDGNEEFLCLEDYNPLSYDQIFGKDGKPDS